MTGLWSITIALAQRSLDRPIDTFYDAVPSWVLAVIGGIGVILPIVSLLFGGRVNKAYSDEYSVLQKENLRLDNLLKQQELQKNGVPVQNDDAEAGVASEDATLAKPVIEGRLNQNLILRFLVLFIVLAIWDLFVRVWGFLVSQVANVLLNSIPFNDIWGLVVSVVAFLPILGYAVILFVFGWPLLKDVSQALGLKPRALLAGRSV